MISYTAWKELLCETTQNRNEFIAELITKLKEASIDSHNRLNALDSAINDPASDLKKIAGEYKNLAEELHKHLIQVVAELKKLILQSTTTIAGPLSPEVELLPGLLGDLLNYKGNISYLKRVIPAKYPKLKPGQRVVSNQQAKQSIIDAIVASMTGYEKYANFVPRYIDAAQRNWPTEKLEKILKMIVRQAPIKEIDKEIGINMPEALPSVIDPTKLTEEEIDSISGGKYGIFSLEKLLRRGVPKAEILKYLKAGSLINYVQRLNYS